MANISQQKIDNIITYLEMLKKTTTDEDTILSITEIEEDLTENLLSNKIAIVDKLNHILNFTDSLKEQMLILSYNPNAMRVNVGSYSYAIVENLQYMKEELNELKNAIEGFKMQKK